MEGRPVIQASKSILLVVSALFPIVGSQVRCQDRR